MTKELFRKKPYYRLLQFIFWGSLFVFSGGLIIIGLSEDDIPAAGFFWAGIVAIVFWFIKRIFYYILFNESILPKKIIN